jgi:hypothetical protein
MIIDKAVLTKLEEKIGRRIAVDVSSKGIVFIAAKDCDSDPISLAFKYENRLDSEAVFYEMREEFIKYVENKTKPKPKYAVLIGGGVSLEEAKEKLKEYHCHGNCEAKIVELKDVPEVVN